MIGFDLDDDGIVTLTWDLPGRSQNVLNDESMGAFDSALDRALETEGVRGIVVTTGKRDFIAGADLSMIQGMARRAGGDVRALYDEVGQFTRLFRKLETCGLPVVAAMRGTALGGGLELALACHRRIAVDDPRAKLGLPEVTLGLLPGAGGTQRLPRLVGIKAALPLLLEGRRIGVRDAHQLGFVDELVSGDELLPRAKAWLRTGPAAEQPWDRKGYTVPGGAPADLQDVFTGANAMVQAKTQGNYPANQAILSCVFEGVGTALDVGLAAEVRYFSGLLIDPVARNMIRTMFEGQQALAKGLRRPADVPPLALKSLGIAGAGSTGRALAWVAAKQGLSVRVADADLETAQSAVLHAAATEDRRIAKGRSTPDTKAAILGRIEVVEELAALATCDAVIESVPDRPDMKAAVLGALDGDQVPPILTTTAVMRVSDLAPMAPVPEALAGLHPLHPVERSQVVEVVRGEATSDETLAHALDVARALGRVPLVVADHPGLYVLRGLAAYVREAFALLDEGVSAAVIENSARRLGMAQTPLQVADGLGARTVMLVALAAQGADAAGLRAAQSRTEGPAGWRPLRLSRDDRFVLDPELAGSVEADPERVRQRLLVAQVVAACACLDAGTIETPTEVDVGAVLGWGFPGWTGGPASHVDTVGAAAFVALADELATAYGARFSPPASLRALAESGGRLHEEAT